MYFKNYFSYNRNNSSKATLFTNISCEEKIEHTAKHSNTAPQLINFKFLTNSVTLSKQSLKRNKTQLISMSEQYSKLQHILQNWHYLLRKLAAHQGNATNS